MPTQTEKPETNPSRVSDLLTISPAEAKASIANPPPSPARPGKNEANPHAREAATPLPRRRKTMSPAQLAANRANARKSTGPRTPEGKARSSRNALKHGLLARHLVLGDNDPHEVRQEFRILLLGLLDDYRPQTHAQKALVHTIAACYWRLRRALRFETQSILAARQRSMCEPPAHRKSEMGHQHCPPNPQSAIRNPQSSIILPDAPDLDRLLIYESAIQRDLARAQRELERMRKHDSRRNAHERGPGA